MVLFWFWISKVLFAAVDIVGRIVHWSLSWTSGAWSFGGGTREPEGKWQKQEKIGKCDISHNKSRVWGHVERGGRVWYRIALGWIYSGDGLPQLFFLNILLFRVLFLLTFADVESLLFVNDNPYTGPRCVFLNLPIILFSFKIGKLCGWKIQVSSMSKRICIGEWCQVSHQLCSRRGEDPRDFVIPWTPYILPARGGLCVCFYGRGLKREVKWLPETLALKPVKSGLCAPGWTYTSGILISQRSLFFCFFSIVTSLSNLVIMLFKILHRNKYKGHWDIWGSLNSDYVK